MSRVISTNRESAGAVKACVSVRKKGTAWLQGGITTNADDCLPSVAKTTIVENDCSKLYGCEGKYDK